MSYLSCNFVIPACPVASGDSLRRESFLLKDSRSATGGGVTGQEKGYMSEPRLFIDFLTNQSRCGIGAALQSVHRPEAADTLYLGGPQMRTENER
jgi:hypothetical protein